jgi:hypothetical protein
MTQNQQIAILIAFIIALIGGYFISRKAAAHEKIYGGTIPTVLNYIVSAAMISIAPSVLCSTLVLHNGFWFSIGMVAVIFVIAVGSSMIFAVFENGARKAALSKKVDRGWTEEDARTSGL